MREFKTQGDACTNYDNYNNYGNYNKGDQKMSNCDKSYNTHLVQLWLNHNRDNCMACVNLDDKKLNKLMNNDGALMMWLTFREYGTDSDKIEIDKDKLYLDAIRQTIKDNKQEYCE